ncbi:hypothetical protein EYS14_00960 [Alteromonadaceae bacterium M269]|nr:hypothetical protein EYS14_00960 [Alteromonadaceae bacterium M269]
MDDAQSDNAVTEAPAKKDSTKPTKTDAGNASTQTYEWQQNYSKILQKVPVETKPYIPNQFRSSLMYIVLENELSLKNKRRIVSLSNDDLLYSSVAGKCVFFQIDWDKDFNNIIKVHENNHTWETQFSELIDTRPVALRNLFARSEVWAEGNYPSLTS